MDVGIVEALCDYSRPVFLFGASIRRGVSRGRAGRPLRYPTSIAIGRRRPNRGASIDHFDVRLETHPLIHHPSRFSPRAPQA